MTLTYLDANVLIAAFRGESDIAFRALEVRDDSERQFVVSDYLRLDGPRDQKGKPFGGREYESWHQHLYRQYLT